MFDKVNLEDFWNDSEYARESYISKPVTDDMIFLDYRECGPNGNPKVVHVDQEFDYKITELAENFETFIEMLQNEDDFGE